MARCFGALRAAALLGCALPALSVATAAAKAAEINLPAQALDVALSAIARQANVNIIYRKDVVRVFRAPVLKGNLTAFEAVQKVVAGTNLEAIASGDHSIIVRPKVAPSRTSAITQFAPREAVEQAPAAKAPVTAEAAPAEEMRDIIVTGSRVTNGNNSPTPVTIVSVQQLQATRPATVFEALLDVPAFGGSRGGTSSNPTGNSASSGQISALNLRNLGPVRTLILYDGHRLPPTQQDGLVDANTVPQMLLQRVDVVTGGASAVYGSDAIGGVVNFITDRKYTGIKVDAQRGISQRGDAGTYQIGAAFGTNLFGGRGHFEASVENLHDDGILDRNQRTQFQQRWTVQGNGCPGGIGSTNCVPFYLAAGANATSWTYGGKITSPASTTARPNPFLNYTFDGVGSALRPFVNGATIPGTTSVQIGGDGIYDTGTTLKPRQDILQAFARFDFDLTDDIHFYVSNAYTRDKTFNNFGDLNSNGLTILSNNAFLARDYPTVSQSLIAANIPSFQFSKKYGLGDKIPPTNVDNTTTTNYVTAGLEGQFGNGYKWEAGYIHSETKLVTNGNYTFNNGPFFAAIDAVDEGTVRNGVANGNIVCRVTITNPSLYPGCVPIDLFGVNSESQAAVDYVRRQGKFVTRLPLDDFNASVTGAPFELWAGPVTIALSGEWRRQRLRVDSTNPTVDYAPLNCTGLILPSVGGLAPLTQNCLQPTTTNPNNFSPSYNGGVPNRPTVHQDVAEVALETDVPLLKDVPFVEALNLNLAGRYTKYWAIGNPDITKADFETTFTAKTWKVGIDWKVSDLLRLRATRSRDIRAPNLYELYRPNATTFSNGTTDYLTGRNLTGAGTLPGIVNGGNPNLKPEVADTLTAGIVLKPFSQLSIAVDYYNIKIRNFITTLNGSDQIAQQLCYGGNAFYCSLQERPGPLTDVSAANAVTRYYSLPANIANQSTKGLDVEVNFQSRIGGQPFSIRGLVTYQPHLYFNQPGAVRQDYAGALGVNGSAKLRMTAYIHYAVTDAFSIDWQTRFRGKMHQSQDPTLLEEKSAGAPSANFSNLSLAYVLPAFDDGRATIYMNVSNIFDQKAPVAASYTTATSPGISGGFVLGDDPIGRYYRVGVRLRL